MDKFFKTVLFFIFAFSLTGFPFSAVAGDGLEIDPSGDPLFDVENFFPGRSASAVVTVKNNFDEKGEISVKTQDIVENRDGFAEFLELSIRKDGEELCLKTVEDLSKKNENCELGELDGESSKNFELIITFLHGSGNEYQDKEIEFDFLFLFLGEEGEEDTETVPGVGGGATDDEEDIVLDIYDEQREEVEADSVTITWNTTLPALGRVVYNTTPGQFDLNEGEPSYGYSFFTSRTEEESTTHSVTLTGLTPGTTYYYRIVSYGSLAISREYQFTTLGEEEIDEGIVEGVEDERDPVLEPELREIVEREKRVEEEGEILGVEDERKAVPLIDKKPDDVAGPGILGATLGIFEEVDDLPIIFRYIIIVVLVVFLLWSVIAFKRRREKDNKR